jgi:hypothetical protein
MIESDHFSANAHLEKRGFYVISMMLVHPIHVMKERSVRQVLLTDPTFVHVLLVSKELIAPKTSTSVWMVLLVNMVEAALIVSESPKS